MTNEQFIEKWGGDGLALTALRNMVGGTFTVQHRRRASLIDVADHDLADMERRGLLPPVVPGEDMVSVGWETVHNIVTNEGLDHLLDATLSGATQITAWKVAISKSNTTPLSTHTYAVPGYTEITGSDVDEASRQAWTDGGVSSQSVDNVGNEAVYTAAGTFTAYGAAIVGGGSGAATLADAAGGGKLYSSGLFAASKALTASDTLTTTYTLTSADDGA